MNINFPWKIYPVSNLGNIVSEYTHYDIYRKNTLLLNKYLQNNAINTCTCYYLAIGDAMEELKNNNLFNTHDQWRQLFPFYIEEISMSFKTEIIIITPNIHCNPSFLLKTNTKFKWTLDENSEYKKYTSNNYNVVINIFITPFPSLDQENERFINDLTNKTKIELEEQIQNLIQTKEDIIFLNNFNSQLKIFIDKIKESGVILCNYFAVFNSLSIYSNYDNFYFSPILRSLITNFNNKNYINNLLLKWKYTLTETNTYLSVPSLVEYKFNYVNKYFHSQYLKIIKQDNKLKFIIINTQKNVEYDNIKDLMKSWKF